jgi:SecY interacting protein Syd
LRFSPATACSTARRTIEFRPVSGGPAVIPPDSPSLAADLEAFLDRYIAAAEALRGGLPRHLHDPRWPSPCEVGAPDDRGWVAWRPVRRPPADFSGLERALEVALHPDVATWFGAWYSECLPARAEEGGLTLIFVWSDADFDRLLENLIGHAIAKRRAREPLTLFVACTDEEDLNLSVDNETGVVVLERPGGGVLDEVAPSLAGLLGRIDPDPPGP